MAYVEIFRDNFDDGIQNFQTSGVGSITESSGVLHITNSGADAEWFSGAGTAPIAYIGSEQGNVDGYNILRYETRITSFTGSGSTRRSCGITLFTQDRLNWVQFHFREDYDRLLLERGIDGVGELVVETGTITHPSSVPLRLRITLHKDSGVTVFEYSDDDGTTYTSVGVVGIKFNPTYIGLFGREWYSGITFNIEYDWLSISIDDSDPFEAFDYMTGTGLIDEVEFLDQPNSSHDRHTFPQISPGESTHEKLGTFTDEIDFLNQPTTDSERHTYPQVSPGEIKIDPGAGFGDAIDFLDQPGTSPNRHTFPQVSPGHRDYNHNGGFSEAASLDLTAGPTYMADKFDVDGYELLYDVNVEGAIIIDTTEGGFGDPTNNNHWGGARDGKYYADGYECGTGGFTFGTLASGFNKIDWMFAGDEPFGEYIRNSVSLVADDSVRFSGTYTSWQGDIISSRNKWYFEGDFDVQVQFRNWSQLGGQVTFELAAVSNVVGTEGTNQFYLYLHGGGYYEAARIINNGDGGLGSLVTADTAGKLRITRVSNVYQAYVWQSGMWQALGSSYSHANLNGPIYINVVGSGNNSSTMSVDAYGFAINSGTITNRTGWYRETPGTHRGLRPDMPENLMIATTKSSIELLDVDNDKLWMRFIQGTNNAMGETAANTRAHKVKWNDGSLLVSYGSPPNSEGGAAIAIDFTTNNIRWYREQPDSHTGGYYRGTYRASGIIPLRNSALGGYFYNDDTWQIPDYRVQDVDIFRADGYEYNAIATYEGMSVSRWPRWHLSSSLEYAVSSETNDMRWCLFDEYDGELFYMTAAKIYSRDRSNGSTGWEDVMSGGTWADEYEKDLPGNRRSFTQYTAVLDDGYLYVPANEGIYRVDWPTGSWELFYGKPDSGATYQILPKYSAVVTISVVYESGLALLACGIEGAASSFLTERDGEGTQIILIDLDLHTVWGKSKIYKNWGHAPMVVGV